MIPGIGIGADIPKSIYRTWLREGSGHSLWSEWIKGLHHLLQFVQHLCSRTKQRPLRMTRYFRRLDKVHTHSLLSYSFTLVTSKIINHRSLWGIFVAHSELIPGTVSWVGWHDDVIKWKHFPRYWPFARGIHRSPVNSPHKGQWRGALMFSLIWVWMNGWINNREAGDLRRNRAHYDVTVMWYSTRINRELWCFVSLKPQSCLNILKPRQNGRHFQMHFLEWKFINFD